MIPKKIHYCWFGGSPIPEKDKKCIESWRRYCPDYEIIEWNESNYDLGRNTYMKEAYEAQRWGFVPDYARLDIVYQEGGIYLDTDVEIIRPIDELLLNSAFCGFESDEYVNFGLGFGAEKGHPIICEMMSAYDEVHFLKEDGTLNLLPSPAYQTDVLLRHGLVQDGSAQMLDGVRVYPSSVFNPKSNTTGIISLSSDTLSIHHFNMSWKTKREQKIVSYKQTICSLFGEDRGQVISKYLLLPLRVVAKIQDYGVTGAAKAAHNHFAKD